MVLHPGGPGLDVVVILIIFVLQSLVDLKLCTILSNPDKRLQIRHGTLNRGEDEANEVGVGIPQHVSL